MIATIYKLLYLRGKDPEQTCAMHASLIQINWFDLFKAEIFHTRDDFGAVNPAASNLPMQK